MSADMSDDVWRSVRVGTEQLGGSAMTRTVSANEAKNRLGALVRSVAESGDPVVIKTYGRPRAVIVSVEAHEELERLRDAQRRAEALSLFRQARAEVLAHNLDMTDEEREAFAITAGREIMRAAAQRAQDEQSVRTSSSESAAE